MLAGAEISQKSQPNNVDRISLVGYIERRQGKWDDAVANFRKAAELNPGSGLSAYDLGETYKNTRRYREAFEALHHGIEIAPDEPDSYVILIAAELD